MTRPQRCPKGHDLDDANCYEESTASGRIVFRCRKCRAAQRRTGRRAPGPDLDLAERAAIQRPSDDDIRRSGDLWASGAAGEACRRAGVRPVDLARMTGTHPTTAKVYLNVGGQRPQPRHAARFAAVALAIGALPASRPEHLADEIGDQVLLAGGRPDRVGPWHASPPHGDHHIGLNQEWLGSGNPTGPRHFDWWPCAGFVDNIRTSHRLLEAHGYLEDPRTHERATACHGIPGWRHDCPNSDGTCQAVSLGTAAWTVHMADLYAANGCQPGCPHGRDPQRRQPRHGDTPPVTTATPPAKHPVRGQTPSATPTPSQR